jgi:hypothetical protein
MVLLLLLLVAFDRSLRLDGDAQQRRRALARPGLLAPWRRRVCGLGR